MTNYKRMIAAAMLCAFAAAGTLSAQESEFDLSSQRSERQDVLPVPGKVIDHKGVVVNPVPHHMKLDGIGRLGISGGVMLIDKKGAFASDVDFLKVVPKGVALTIDFGEKVSQDAGVKQVKGAYALRVDAKGITITGYDEAGTFYGLQTLRQLAQSRPTCVPYVEINDYPDLTYRGVVEGFYGTPWSHEVRLSLIDFYGKHKMNTYLYGPKDDPYHSCPNWRLPYPEKEAANIKDLVNACRKNRVEFVWAIHPGQDIKWNEEDYANVLRKFNWMYDMGVRSFAIFFDDISGEGTRSDRQVGLLNRLTEEFVNVKGDVAPLTVCPTDYSRLWAGPGPNDQLATYGRTLDPSVKVFYTGDVVCSDLTNETMDWVNSRIQRPAYYWWNYPVTDYCRHIIMQGPVYGLSTTITAADASGVVSNPMEHGEASKLALYSTADYCWNVAEYNAIDSWERALTVLAGEHRDAYRTFAIHSCDTENGYRRDESWETTTFRMAQWTDAAADALYAEFDKVEKAPAELRKCDNRLLLTELEPWLVEFEKLGRRGKGVIELGRMFRNGGSNADFWNKYVALSMSEADRAAYAAHKCGTMKLHPFYENAMDDMAFEYLKRLMGETPVCYRGIGSWPSAYTTLTKLMFDGDESTHFTSGAPQKDGSWLGVDLGSVRPVTEIAIKQGRNSVDDVDYFDHCALECSADGKTWTVLLDDLKQQYEINWTGDATQARYVRLRRLDSTRTNYAAIRTFVVNPITLDNLGFSIAGDKAQDALKAFDSDVNTAFEADGALTLGTESGAKAFTVLFAEMPADGFVVKQLNNKGKVVAQAPVSGTQFAEITLAKGATKLLLQGKAKIAEIIVKK